MNKFKMANLIEFRKIADTNKKLIARFKAGDDSVADEINENLKKINELL